MSTCELKSFETGKKSLENEFGQTQHSLVLHRSTAIRHDPGAREYPHTDPEYRPNGCRWRRLQACLCAEPDLHAEPGLVFNRPVSSNESRTSQRQCIFSRIRGSGHKNAGGRRVRLRTDRQASFGRCGRRIGTAHRRRIPPIPMEPSSETQSRPRTPCLLPMAGERKKCRSAGTLFDNPNVLLRGRARGIPPIDLVHGNGDPVYR